MAAKAGWLQAQRQQQQAAEQQKRWLGAGLALVAAACHLQAVTLDLKGYISHLRHARGAACLHSLKQQFPSGTINLFSPEYAAQWILGMELPELDFLAMVSAVRGCWVALR
jgi:hypothetical protein